MREVLILFVAVFATTSMEATVMTLSFHDPATFEFGSEKQKAQLRTIADSEFSLAHLPNTEQELVEEALRFSGIEVENACVVEKKTNAKINVFFRRMKQNEHHRFNPRLGVMKLAQEDGEEDAVDLDWQKIYGSYTEYPYPLGEAQVIPKTIPVNLSSVKISDRTEEYVRFNAAPSELLFAVLPPKEQILAADDLEVEFEVDLDSVRVTRQSLRLKKPKRVYFGIKIRELSVDHEYAYDAAADRNVMKSVNHSMRGRIGGMFRPNFSISTSLEYSDCEGKPREQSHLYEAIDAIQRLQ